MRSVVSQLNLLAASAVCLLSAACAPLSIKPDSQLAAESEASKVTYERHLLSKDDAKISGYKIEDLDISWTLGGSMAIKGVQIGGQTKKFKFTVRNEQGQGVAAACATDYESASTKLLGGSLTKGRGGLDCTFTGKDGGQDGSIVVKGTPEAGDEITGRLVTGPGALHTISVDKDSNGKVRGMVLGYEVRNDERSVALLQTIGERKIWVLKAMDPLQKLSVMAAGMALTIHTEVLSDMAESASKN